MLTRPRQRPVSFGDYKQKDWDVNEDSGRGNLPNRFSANLFAHRNAIPSFVFCYIHGLIR